MWALFLDLFVSRLDLSAHKLCMAAVVERHLLWRARKIHAAKHVRMIPYAIYETGEENSLGMAEPRTPSA